MSYPQAALLEPVVCVAIAAPRDVPPAAQRETLEKLRQWWSKRRLKPGRCKVCGLPLNEDASVHLDSYGEFCSSACAEEFWNRSLW